MRLNVCCVENCNKTGRIVKGLCSLHYQRWRNDIPFDWTRTEHIEWIQVAILSRSRLNCWIDWPYAVDKDGYPRVYFEGKEYRATWISLHLDGRPIQESKIVCHTCDTPLCLNPNHLYWGTYLDNAIDRDKRGRGIRQDGEKNHNAKLSVNDVREIRRLYSEGLANQSELAIRYGITRPGISLIVTRRNWKHI